MDEAEKDRCRELLLEVLVSLAHLAVHLEIVRTLTPCPRESLESAGQCWERGRDKVREYVERMRLVYEG